MNRNEYSCYSTLHRKSEPLEKTASNHTRWPNHIQANRIQLRSTVVLIQVKSPLLYKTYRVRRLQNRPSLI